jgi:protocatechuate 3,4-dioxygenase beta subunit
VDDPSPDNGPLRPRGWISGGAPVPFLLRWPRERVLTEGVQKPISGNLDGPAFGSTAKVDGGSLPMKNGDRHVGRVLTRRESLTLLSGAAAGTTLLAASGHLGSNTGKVQTAAGATLPSCIVRPEQTQGPYFVDEKLHRSDIRSDPTDGSIKQGVPLRLLFRVTALTGNACRPLAGATVDVWHCDALGVYSDTRDPIFGDTRGRKFLRGYQWTSDDGTAEFLTIYPGWYQGRTVHVHFKIRTGSASTAHHEFTSQLYFEDTLTDRVHTQLPYARKGQRTLRNAGDGNFRSAGANLLLKIATQGEGYAAAFDVALQMA